MKVILLKNGILYDLKNNKYNKKNIVISDGKIKEISENISEQYEDTEVINLNEKLVFPGFIDCHTYLGIIEECTGEIGADNNETSDPVTPHLNGIDGINPFDISFKDAMKSGITCVMSGPGSNNVVVGRNVDLKTCGTIIDKMVIKNPAGFKVPLGENPLSVHAHRADDIVAAVRIAEEFKISKIVIEHGTEAHLVKSYLKEKNIPVAYGPLLTPRIKMELKGRNYGFIVELFESGVKTELITDHPYNSIDCLMIMQSNMNVIRAFPKVVSSNLTKCVIKQVIPML